MPTNPYFRNFEKNVTSEQMLFEDLITESIQINGHDVYYMPRESYNQIDNLFGEDVLSRFSSSYTMEMQILDVKEYEGQGDFFSKFGLDLRQNMKLAVSASTFSRWMPTTVRNRPREGDLIYVPVLQKILEIEFIEQERFFKALGQSNAYYWELRCTLFRYSNENISTGVEEVDSIENRIASSIRVFLGSGTGNYMMNEIVYQGTSLATATFTGAVNDWNPVDKQLSIIHSKGSPMSNTLFIGVTSNTRYNTTRTDDMEDYDTQDIYDNRLIQTEANTIMVFAESNVFGNP